MGATIKAVSVNNGNLSDIASYEYNIITWNATTIGGFIGADGNPVSNGRYDSMLTQLQAGKSYNIHQQVKAPSDPTSNHIRTFRLSGTTYTQVNDYNSSDSYTYQCPTDSNTYVLQTVVDHYIISNTPWIEVES